MLTLTEIFLLMMQVKAQFRQGNEVFVELLGETMEFECNIQMRKFSILIENARIEKNHQVLDIGNGRGTFAVEVVKITGCNCKCVGINLSEKQMKFVAMKVEQACLRLQVI
ncbi:uncharacterized protein [Euphorbia lathyris]|uniref:uncharacterized protein n=1 Tax=Euphorbia lathyris TaxID=212925 RepID=UPI0033135F0B